MKKSLVVLGHGSRSDEAVKVFKQIVEEIEKKSGFDMVRGAHMELAEPGLEETVAFLSESGTGMIVISPYFLYNGMHIKKDIPEMIDNLSKKYPHISIRLARPIGFEPVLADIVLRRAEEAEKC